MRARGNVRHLFTLFILRLLSWFFGLTVVLTGVILAGHYLITLRFLLPGMITASVLLKLIPHLVGYVIPVSLSMSLGFVMHHLYESHEFFILLCLRSAYRAWRRALITLLGVGFFFVFFCIGWAGPYCYRSAKKEIAQGIARVIFSLSPDSAMQLTPFVYLWYHHKKSLRVWSDVRFYVTSNSGISVLTAREACLQSDSFLLKRGSFHEEGSSHSSYHEFEKMIMPYSLSDKSFTKSVRPRHATVFELYKQLPEKTARRECVRRLTQGVLSICAPLFLLFSLSYFTTYRMLFVILYAIGSTALIQVAREIVSSLF